MADYAGLLDRGAEVAADNLELAVVPALVGLLAVGNVEKVLASTGFHFGLKFPFPAAILDVWSFVSVPSQGVSGPSAVPLLALPVFALVRGLLAAGYLGAIRGALAGRPGTFLESVEQYGLPLIGFQLLQVVAVLALVAPALLSPLLLVVVFPLMVVAGYAFFATPYLVVAADEPLAEALRHSYELAVGGGAYLGFFVRFLLGGVGLSLVATPLVVNLGIGGVLVGTLLLAPVALALNATTMALVVDLLDGSREGSSRESADGRPPGDVDGWTSSGRGDGAGGGPPPA